MESIILIQAENESVGILVQTLQGIVEGFMARLPFLFIGLIVFLVFWAAGRLLRGVIGTAGRRTRLDITLAILLGRLATAAMLVMGLLVAAVVVFPTFRPGDLVTGLGITSVAIGFAFKDILQNFFAGVLILWRRPFVVGDVVRVMGFEGKVEEINIRSTRLKTYDGERAILPNGDVYTSAVLVLTAYPARRMKFTVGVGYLDDVEHARRTIARAVHDTKGVLKDPGPWIYVSELAASSVNFTVYFWIDSRHGEPLRTSDEVVTGVKYALDQEGIDMPYPHKVVLFHDATGSRQGDIERETDFAARNENAPAGS